MALTPRDYSTTTGLIKIINEDIHSTLPINGMKLNSIEVAQVQLIESILAAGPPTASDSLIDDTK